MSRYEEAKKIYNIIEQIWKKSRKKLLFQIDKSEFDEIDSLLPKHNKFILPCGVPSATKAHICRTVARRAERCICALSAEEPVSENILKLINRLSDYLFVLARYCNNIENKDEIFWDNHC